MSDFDRIINDTSALVRTFLVSGAPTDYSAATARFARAEAEIEALEASTSVEAADTAWNEMERLYDDLHEPRFSNVVVTRYRASSAIDGAVECEATFSVTQNGKAASMFSSVTLVRATTVPPSFATLRTDEVMARTFGEDSLTLLARAIDTAIDQDKCWAEVA